MTAVEKDEPLMPTLFFPSLDARRPTDPDFAAAKLLAGKMYTGQRCESRTPCTTEGRHFDWRGWRCDDHEPLASWEHPPVIGGEFDKRRRDPTKRWPWSDSHGGRHDLALSHEPPENGNG